MMANRVAPLRGLRFVLTGITGCKPRPHRLGTPGRFRRDLPSGFAAPIERWMPLALNRAGD
jgi:hypothetical protein